MPRATNAPASRLRRKRVLTKAKGFYGARSKLFRNRLRLALFIRRHRNLFSLKRRQAFRQIHFPSLSSSN